MILENDVSLNHNSLIPHPKSLTKRVPIFFQKSTQRRLAIIDLTRDCVFSSGLIRRTVCLLLLSCYCILLSSPLSTLLSTKLPVLSLSHPITRVQWIQLLFSSSRHSAWWKPTVSWLKLRCRFQSFARVKQRLFLLLSCWLVLQHYNFLSIPKLLRSYGRFKVLLCDEG